MSAPWLIAVGDCSRLFQRVQRCQKADRAGGFGHSTADFAGIEERPTT